MHRLAKFQHHVVRDIDRRADRAHARAPQALTQRIRRGATVVDAAHDAACETRAAAAGPQDAPAGCPGSTGAVTANCWPVSAPPVSAATSRATPEHRHGIAAVRRDVQVQDDFIELQIFAQVRAERLHRRAARGCPRASPRCPVPARSTACRATPRRAAWPALIRTSPGSSAPTVASARAQSRAGIGGAAHDLHRRTAADRAPAHPQLVGLRMRSALTISATTTPLNAGAAELSDSSSKPAMVRRAPRSAASHGTSTHSLSQSHEIFMSRSPGTAPGSAGRSRRTGAGR